MSLFHRFTATAAPVLAACFLLPASSFAQLSFQTHSVTSTGQASVSMHADFNGDGREDLVSGKTLLLSNGDGSYQAPIALPASVDAIGDFNNDGKLDFLSYRTSNGPITPIVYLGNGDGTFQAGKTVTGAGPAANSQIFYLVVSDVNHDGKTDFITVNETTGNDFNGYPTIVQTWLSNGDGSFAKGQQFTTQDPDPNNRNIELGQALIGDFDGDGKPDLAIVYELYYGPTIVQLWFGDGAGNLGSSYYLDDPNGYYDAPLTVADVNNDGKEDLIGPATGFLSTTVQGYSLLTMFTGNANRTLTYSNIATSQCPGLPAVADFNGDGINDLAYNVSSCAGYPAPNENMTYVVALGKGAGAFGPEQTIGQDVSGGYAPSAIKTTTGTRPDLVYTQLDPGTNSNPTDIALLTNTSTGSFPGCGFTGAAEGITVCSPTATSGSPVKFSVATAGPTPMRTAAVWVDGAKASEQLTHAFSNYSFLDASLTLGVGPHAITIFGTGWDNTLQKDTFTLTVGGSSSGGSCPPPSSAGVNICSPGNYTTVASPVTVSAAATVTGTLQRMEVWIDGVKKYTETTSNSFSTSFVIAPGTHVIDVYAANTSGGLWKSTSNITVSGSTGCNAPASPGVNVCAPVNGSTVGSPTTVTAASTITGTLARMEIWVDGNKKFTETTSTSFSTTLTIPAGSHQFAIYSVNTAGTKYETSVTATVN